MKEEEVELPPDIKVHANGEWYKEIQMDGMDEPLKLFNTLKPQRLEGETHYEYQMRKLIKNKYAKEQPEMFYNPREHGRVPYVNKNKKDKFKKKKK